MAETLPGPHHCLGAARAAADIVYRSLHAQCVARGGTLSVEDLEHCYAEIIEGFSCGFDIFEQRHLNCMHASMSIAEMPFTRERILATILRACGEAAARQVFAPQAEQYDEDWLRPFFDGFAHYVRQHLCADADQRLTAAYIEAGLTHKGKITLGGLLSHKIVLNVLRDCARPLAEQPIPSGLVGQVCGCVNGHAARHAATAQAPAINVVAEQMAVFLTLLASQIAMRIPAGLAQHDAELYSLATGKKKSTIVL